VLPLNMAGIVKLFALKNYNYKRRVTMTVNEKIAKWCGIRFQTLDDLNYRYRHAGNLKWVAPDGTILSTLPDFQNDFNACLQWVVPKLEKYCTLSFKYYNELWYCGILTHMKNIEVMVTNRSLSVAFTDAIEKLIDSEEKK
jgi:hypothetical protein